MNETMQQQATLSVMAGEPQFATVTFVSDDNVPGSTFRVPLSGATTVCRLAKDAMKRLVLSRPSEDRHRQAPSIVVTEVYVGGTGTQPKAEVFAQDIVNQVVLVKEEIIYMKLRAGPSSTAPSRLPTPPPPLSEATQRSVFSSTNTEATASANPTKTAAPTQMVEHKADSNESRLPSNAELSSTAATTSSPHTTTQSLPARRDGTATSTTEPTSAPVTCVSAVAPSRRPGWGPEAYERFAANYVSTPGKRPRTGTRTKAAASAEPRGTKKAKTEAKTKPAEKDSAAAADREADRGLRWGPEASKSFPANYVSSPEKLARLARQQRRTTNKATTHTGGASPSTTAPPPQVRVSRELLYPSEQTETGRATVSHPVEREVITVEEDVAPATPAVELPKGWGAESLRYFDPNTYCDDPKKARLMPNMDLSRPVRQRRPVSP